MISLEDRAYGWGSGALPMPREGRRHSFPLPATPQQPAPLRLVRDLPWRALLGSVLVTVAACLALLLIDRHLPPMPDRPETPMKIAVRWREQPPPPPPAVVARTEIRPLAVKKPLPRPRPEREVPPPRTAPVAAPAPPVPEPPPAAPAPEEPRLSPPAPALRPATVEVNVPLPDLRRREKKGAEDSLPAMAVALGRHSAPEIAAATEASRERYLDRAATPATAAPARQEALAASRTGEADPGALPAIDSQRFERRPAAAAPPIATGETTAFAANATPEVAPPSAAAAARKQQADVPPALPAVGSASFDFLGPAAPADFDRRYLVSLSRLRTCLDPQAEMKLRTRLATLLGRPEACRAGGVIFDFRQPESAWSIHVDIYNFEQREFKDRCAALQLAVECCERARR